VPWLRIDASFREEHVLRDGTRVTLRLMRPDDRDALRAGFARLSQGSRYRRFLGGATEMNDTMLDYLTQVDGVDHVALVALRETFDLKEEVVVGVSRFVRLADEPDVAEAAVTVIDELQNLGLAKLLSGPTRDAALERGIKHFRAEVLLSNAPMRRLLEGAGARVVEETPDTLVFDVPLLPDQADTRPSFERVLAAAASSMAVFIRRLTPPAARSTPPTE